jgi:2'-hydroxyisoflavone reductase
MYAFVSTISVYTGEGGPPNEDAPLHPADFESAEITNDTYGGLKVACEQVVQEVMAGRNLIVRPGIIVGPYDYMNRFLYWAKRIAQGGEMAAPGDPERPVQVLDVRDLAAFVLDRVEAGAGGTFNLVGPAETLTMQGMLDEMRGVTGGDASVTWVPDEFLDRDDEWKKMPLWAPADDNDLFLTSNARALAAGLMLRPLADTIRDHIAADEADPPETTPPGGFDPEREAELLAAWHAEAAAPASAASE